MNGEIQLTNLLKWADYVALIPFVVTIIYFHSSSHETLWATCVTCNTNSYMSHSSQS